jgi:uncharacterized RDD family membrane protein YckC
VILEAAPIRELPTPEGVPLRFAIARPGDRLAALCIDLAILWAAAILIALAIFIGAPVGESGDLALAVLAVSLFLLRAFYFPFFELRWLGQTPGKKALGIRVVDRNGGPLRARAVLARGLLRELELFQPLQVLLAPAMLAPGMPPWAGLVAGSWALACASLPFFNRDCLRAGDLAAGTLVVRSPKRRLLDDLATGAPREAGVFFSKEQLGIYGAFELETLEALLRQGDGPGAGAALETIAARIQRKIGWVSDGPPPRPYDFLRAFYAAQRAHLEQRLLFGVRRARKDG